MTGMLTLKPCRKYYFDAKAADRAVRFIEKFCKHFQTPHAGKPFKLSPIQKKIVRDIFGWKHRRPDPKWKQKIRRFQHVYWEAACGAGKSPLLAAIGLYCTMADGQRGGQGFSLASTYSQARIVFDTARGFVNQEAQLSCRLSVVEREIRHRASRSIWKIVSGKGPGAGCSPTFILTDEAHDISSSKAYDDLVDRMIKRAQPLSIVATNSGETRFGFCWKLRERAVLSLQGKGDPSLYPIIWAAPETSKTDDPAAWRLANPLIGVTIAQSKIAAKCQEAMKDADEERKFRRLYLSIWPNQQAGRWLDMDRYAAVEKPFDASSLVGKALYLGLDMSLCDDLCSLIAIWIDPTMAWLAPWFWIPRATAEHYREKDSVPYDQWVAGSHIELLETPTVGAAAHQLIADRVLALRKQHKLEAVLYDRARALQTIALIEAAGVTCVPMAQGWGVSDGTAEMERRIKDQTITIAPNPVMRFCAENTCVAKDRRGNIWPIKPGANIETNYAGDRGAKIDGMAAAVTALTLARKHVFPAAVQRWKGTMTGVRT